jgi:hypothetical protein
VLDPDSAFLASSQETPIQWSTDHTLDSNSIAQSGQRVVASNSYL